MLRGENGCKGGKAFQINVRGMETSGIDTYDESTLLVDRRLTQIQVVAPGGLSKVAKARRDRLFPSKTADLLDFPLRCLYKHKGKPSKPVVSRQIPNLAAPWRL